MARTRLAQMYLIVALCLLCGWVAPHACRSVDVRDPPSEDLEPFVAHHHHEGNIAELLIPLLERSLAQSEARSNERQHRKSKAGKKVIQVLPYRGSEEHKRKGWRKLNSHKKQVVEITPLHGKNRAKPLAYILSAAKPSHAEHAEAKDDLSSSNTSELEHDKSTSEEQQSSEEKTEDSETVDDNSLRSGNPSDSPSASSNAQSSEDEESKDISVSDRESADVTSDSDISAEKSEDRKVVVVEESEEDEVQSISKQHPHHNHHLSVKSMSVESLEEKTEMEEDAESTTEESNVTFEDTITTEEDTKSTVEDFSTTLDDRTVTLEADTTEEAADVTAETHAETEDLEHSVEDSVVTAKDGDVTVEDVEVTVENRAATIEDVELTVEDKATTVEEETAPEEENVTLEERTAAVSVEDQLTVADDGITEPTAITEAYASASEDNVTIETGTTAEVDNAHPTHALHVHAHPHLANNDITDINNLINNIGQEAKVDKEDSDEHNRPRYADNDIVISRRRQDAESAEEGIRRLFNTKTKDVIELVKSSVQAPTTHKDCLQTAEKHHDHKSYRLSFLFNK